MTIVDGGPVATHAQAFADEINRRFGFTHIMTYPSHEPDLQHALDCFSTPAKMLELANWCTRDDVIDHFGIDYVIHDVYKQSNAGEIYNREIARYWRTMADRGGITQNHHDHVHISFNKTGSATPFGGTSDTPATSTVSKIQVVQEDDDMRSIIWQEPGGPNKDGLYECMGPFIRWIQNGDDFWALVNSGGVAMDAKGNAVIVHAPAKAFYAKSLVGPKPYPDYSGAIAFSK